MNKKIIIFLLIIFLLVGCSKKEEKFSILTSNNLNYAVYHNKDYALYVLFTEVQLNNYRLAIKSDNYSNSYLIKDLLDEKEAQVSKFIDLDDNNLPILNSKDISIDNNNFFVLDTRKFLDFKQFDKKLLKNNLKNLIKQYKERIK